MPAKFWSLGHRAEKKACRFLKRRGYMIVERNVRVGQDEIDIVAVHHNVVIFVEVRFRQHGLEAAFLSAEGAKGHRLSRAVAAYRSREQLWSTPCRTDVVAVTRQGRRWHIAHARDVKCPGHPDGRG